MKKSVVSKSRYFIGIAIVTAILIISNSCSKSAMNNMYGTVVVQKELADQLPMRS